MCLDYVSETRLGTSEEVLEGWKVFLLKGGKLQSLFFSALVLISRNTWLIAEGTLVDTVSCGGEGAYKTDHYEAGFHIFDKLEDAQRYMKISLTPHHYQVTIAKVKYKGILARGLQFVGGILGYAPVTVAKYMYIPGE